MDLPALWGVRRHLTKKCLMCEKPRQPPAVPAPAPGPRSDADIDLERAELQQLMACMQKNNLAKAGIAEVSAKITLLSSLRRRRLGPTSSRTSS